ncbi:MAG: FKBP-type peptidyl-prolyl cis-trans isomerase [Ferruginibacter sp.]
MKKVLLSSIVLLTVTCTVTAQNDTKAKAKPGVAKVPAKTAVKAGDPQFKNLLDSFSYAAGFNVATNMQAQGITQLNPAIMQKGLEDVFKKNPSKMTPEVVNAVMQKQLDIFAAEKAAVARTKGKAFLEANKKRKEVTTLPDGLQYEVIKNGDANSPTAKSVDTVVVNYRVALFDGEDIENSFKSGQPAIFPVMGVIKGWIEVLQLMRKGDHWKVYVPSELAYDAAGNGPAIPPHSTLKFEISLEEIRPFVAKPGQ